MFWKSGDWVAIAGVIILVLFFVGREIMCWYWKINTIIELLKSIDAQLNTANDYASRIVVNRSKL